MRTDIRTLRDRRRSPCGWLLGGALLSLIQALPAHADGDPVQGKIVFGRCAACHSVTGQNRLGPPLDGVVGRPAGSVAQARYSSAMRNAGAVWDEHNLDRFLAAPGKFLPGTTMMLALPQARDRSDLIAYLKTLASP